MALTGQARLLSEMPGCNRWHWRIDLTTDHSCDYLLHIADLETTTFKPIDMQICVLRSLDQP